MKRYLVICAILVLAVAPQAYGMGSHGGHHDNSGAVYSSGSFATNSGSSLPAGAASLPPNGENGTKPIGVPEPATLLLLGAGLVGIVGLKRKMK